MKQQEFLWTEKWRPQTVAECVLPPALERTFKGFVDQGELQNLLLHGRRGMGKTTVAQAMFQELGLDWIKVNGSLNGNIDTLRGLITDFASTVSFTSDKRKMVLIDEADYLNRQSTQPALRGFMEEFSQNCGFVLTCNYRNHIIPEIADSRLANVEFKFEKSDFPQLAMRFMKRLDMIFESENVSYEKDVVAKVIARHFPDWRRVLNELQRYAAECGGKIDSGILASTRDLEIDDLVKLVKNKDFANMRKWVALNASTDSIALFRKFYDSAHQFVKPESIPQLVLHLADYQYKSSFSIDQEINTAAFLTNVMADCEFV